MQAFSETSVLNKAMNLAINELLGDANKVNTDIEAYRKVSAEDIRRLANEIFNESNSSTLIYAKED